MELSWKRLNASLRLEELGYRCSDASAKLGLGFTLIGSKTIPRQPVAEDVTLAARTAEDRLQNGSADVQSPQHIDAFVPPSPTPEPTTQPQPAIGHYPLKRRLLRCVLTDALLQLSGPKAAVNSDSATVFKSRQKTFLFSRAFSLSSSQ